MLRDVKVLYWIMGTLLTVSLLATSSLTASYGNRVTALEAGQREQDKATVRLESELRHLRLDVCRVEVTIDEVYEAVTKKPRRTPPCP